MLLKLHSRTNKCIAVNARHCNRVAMHPRMKIFYETFAARGQHVRRQFYNYRTTILPRTSHCDAQRYEVMVVVTEQHQLPAAATREARVYSSFSGCKLVIPSDRGR